MFDWLTDSSDMWTAAKEGSAHGAEGEHHAAAPHGKDHHDGPSHTLHTAGDIFAGVEGLFGFGEAFAHGGGSSTAGHMIKEFGHHAGNLKGAGSFMSNLGTFLGPLGFAMGASELMDATGKKDEDKTLGMTRGLLGMFGGAATTYASTAAAMGGGGALAAGASVAAPLAAAAGAGLMGGQKLGKWVDESSKGDDWFGKDALGRDRSAFDWSADKGVDVEQAVGGGFLGSLLGGATAGALGIGSSLAYTVKKNPLLALAAASPVGALATWGASKLFGSDEKPMEAKTSGIGDLVRRLKGQQAAPEAAEPTH